MFVSQPFPNKVTQCFRFFCNLFSAWIIGCSDMFLELNEEFALKHRHDKGGIPFFERD